MPDDPKDEQLLVTREHGLRLKAINENLRTAEFIASTETIDSYGEIVEQSWDLSRFRDNPIILYAHDRWELPIGKAVRCEVVQDIGGPRLECTIEFATEEMNPKAEQVWQLIQAKMLNAVSVGFRPKEIRYEKRNGKDVYILSDNLLLEISVVTIPANPDALAKAKQKAFEAAVTRTETLAAGVVFSMNFGRSDADLTPEQRAVFERSAAQLRAASEQNAPSPITVPAEAVRTQETTTMTEQEMKAAIEKAEAAQKAAEAQATATKALADETASKALEAEARAKAAEERATGLEASNKALGDVVAKSLEVLGGAKKKAGPDGKPADEDESLVDVAVRTAHVMVEREVDALVGEKILPAEKETFVKLAKTNRELFDEMVAQRGDLGLLKSVAKAAPVTPTTAAADENGEGFGAEVERELGTASRTASEDGDFADALED